MVPETSKNIFLRMAQHHRYNNKAFRLEWSKTIIEAKLRNQRNFLLRYQRNQPNTDVRPQIDILKQCVENLNEKKSIEEVMGVEGFGAKEYFRAYGKLLLNGFVFSKREYHPPPDPVNAMLSFGYMLLFNEMNSLLEAFGFDGFLGFLHSTRYGRASLANDMIEEFRSPLADRLVLYLINQGAINPRQFTSTDKGIRMDDVAIKTFLNNYESFMTTSFVDAKTRERKNYREILRDNVTKLEKNLMDEIPYIPYLFYS